MIHFHGTPLTPRSELLKLAGKHFCVSFADPRDGDWCLANAQSVLWDNGAFSLFTKDKAVDWMAFYSWLEPRLGHPHFAIVPDVIDGGEDANDALLSEWPYRRDLSAPVWHMGEAIDRLLKLADEWPRVAFGSSGAYWQVGSPAWERRADEAFNALASRHSPLPWVHMLRGLALCGDRWPFASADSVNVSRNYKDTHTCPERMARLIDGRQCPVSWSPRPTQREFFGGYQVIDECCQGERAT